MFTTKLIVPWGVRNHTQKILQMFWKLESPNNADELCKWKPELSENQFFSYFDVTKCFVSDILHLLDEGIENLEVRKIFNKFLTNKTVDSDKIITKLSNVIPQI